MKRHLVACPMAREVVWTDPAWEDLEAAAEYIARDSEYYAAAFVQEIKDAQQVTILAVIHGARRAWRV